MLFVVTFRVGCLCIVTVLFDSFWVCILLIRFCIALICWDGSYFGCLVPHLDAPGGVLCVLHLYSLVRI